MNSQPRRDFLKTLAAALVLTGLHAQTPPACDRELTEERAAVTAGAAVTGSYRDSRQAP